MPEYKISFCTVCMNRKQHLQQTLPLNILHNKEYKNLQFIILDYNSTDNLEEFIRTNMREHIESGRLVYYKTPKPLHFNRSHSRNLAYKLASGDIICNIDADNYTGKDFAAYINQEFKKNSNIFLTTLGKDSVTNKRDVLGRICVKKDDFYKIRGYDERMIYYGYEDHDFANRMELSGVTRILIQGNEDHLQAITHDHKDRLSNEFASKNLKALLFNYLTPSSTDFLFFFNNNEYKRGIMVDNRSFKQAGHFTGLKKYQLKYTLSLFQDSWLEGQWCQNNNEITLLSTGQRKEKLFISAGKKCFVSRSGNKTSDFYQISDTVLIQKAIMLYSQITNRMIMDRNKFEGRIIVNEFDFGKDVVYKNFEYLTPIAI